MKKIPKLASGGIINPQLFIATETEIETKAASIIPITITKKRFIKLLMSKGFQRNESIKIHQEYMKNHKYRSRIGLEAYLLFKDSQINKNIIKVYIGNKEINIK